VIEKEVDGLNYYSVLEYLKEKPEVIFEALVYHANSEAYDSMYLSVINVFHKVANMRIREAEKKVQAADIRYYMTTCVLASKGKLHKDTLHNAEIATFAGDAMNWYGFVLLQQLGESNPVKALEAAKLALLWASDLGNFTFKSEGYERLLDFIKKMEQVIKSMPH
jgi:hypothetical protein